MWPQLGYRQGYPGYSDGEDRGVLLNKISADVSVILDKECGASIKPCYSEQNKGVMLPFSALLIVF